MRRLRGWLAGVFVLCVAGVCIRLGFWQLDRLDQRRATNALVAASRALPPLRLDSAGVDSVASLPRQLRYRRAVATGMYEPAGEILLRGRVSQGRPGVHVVVPMRIETGDILLVNRGWLPAPDGATADPRPIRQAGLQRVEGILLEVPTIPEGGVPSPIILPDTGYTSFQRLDLETVSVMLGHRPLSMYLQVAPQDSSAESLSFPVAVPEPELDEGPHLGYAFQWFSFAAIAVIGFLVVVFRTRQRASGQGSQFADRGSV